MYYFYSTFRRGLPFFIRVLQTVCDTLIKKGSAFPLYWIRELTLIIGGGRAGEFRLIFSNKCYTLPSFSKTKVVTLSTKVPIILIILRDFLLLNTNIQDIATYNDVKQLR